MRAQSSIEFLSTYSFLFIILGVVMSLVVFIAASAQASIVQSQCSAFSGPACNFVSAYSNSLNAYSLITLSLTNSQSVPINITNVSVNIQSANAIGSCAPQLLYPGQEATCAINMTSSPRQGSTLQGYYVLNARYCNAGVSRISGGGCANNNAATSEKVTYRGYFSTGVTASKVAVFSVAVMKGPPGLSLIPFNKLTPVSSNTPAVPLNFTIVQNGDWLARMNATSFGYAYNSTNAIAQGWLAGNHIGYATLPFPQTVSMLQSSNTACTSSMMSFASTVVYLNSNAVPAVTVQASGATAVYYAKAQPGLAANVVWYGATDSAAWSPQAPTTYGPTALTSMASRGLYYVVVAWANGCGGAGRGQAISVSGLPA
ncbi:Uncharacterised protein [uncultured archaeon]|nr:Uncharacterised protein [uncultured archaeon]